MNLLHQLIAPGTRSRWSRGLPVFGRLTFPMWQVFDNALDSGVRAQYPGLSLGWFWPQLHRVGIQHARIGNGQDRLLVMGIEAHPYRLPTANQIGSGGVATPVTNGGSFQLYSEADADFPADVLLPQ